MLRPYHRSSRPDTRNHSPDCVYRSSSIILSKQTIFQQMIRSSTLETTQAADLTCKVMASRQRDLGAALGPHFPDLTRHSASRYPTTRQWSDDPRVFNPSIYPRLGLAKAWFATAAAGYRKNQPVETTNVRWHADDRVPCLVGAHMAT